MLSPYILRHATSVARAEYIHVFLRDYFMVCQQSLPKEQQYVLLDNALLWDLENLKCFPAYLRRGIGFCDVVTDPLASPQKSTYSNVAFITEERDGMALFRLERSVSHHYFRNKEEDITKSVLRTTKGWFLLNNLTQSKECAILRTEKDGHFGAIQPDGTVVVPPLYNSIVPMALTIRDIVLFICYKGAAADNMVDVYDINGNCIYRNIGGLFPLKESVKFHLLPEGGCEPSARFVDALQVVKYAAPFPDKPIVPQTYEVKVQNLSLQPCADEHNGPKRLCRAELQIPFCRNTEDVDLFDEDIYDLFFPLAKVVSGYFECTPEEIMLSIPHWQFFRKTHEYLDWATPDLSTRLMTEVPQDIKERLLAMKLSTAQDIADADLSKANFEDLSLEFQIFLLQAQLQYTFSHPTSIEDEE